MKVTFETRCPEPVEQTYPYFGRLHNDEECVVLFTAPNFGVVVAQGNGFEHRPVGYTSALWCEDSFNATPGTLTIE